MKKNLIVIAAPSGAGKTTLCKRLLEAFPHLRLSISSTTRAPRGDEKNGVEYFFLNHEEFRREIQNGTFVEWAEVHGHYYGTSKATVENFIRAGFSVLLDIDVQGAASFRRLYPNECCTLFISPPDLMTLEKRLRDRGTDTEETILKRVSNAREEMKAAPLFDHIVVNDDLDRAFQTFKIM